MAFQGNTCSASANPQLNAHLPLPQLCLEGRDAADGGELHRDVLHLRKDLVRRAACLL